MINRKQLHRDGYALLRQSIPAEWLDDLRAAFDAGIKPSDQWPVPRSADWHHSLLDLDSRVQTVCRLPELLAVVGELIGERFFLSQVEGREPLAGGGHQQLHRDLSAQRPGDTVNALAYFDDYGPENGATRIIPGSHRAGQGEPPFDFNDESRSLQFSGSAGDILVFDADLVHAGSLNLNGARRRSILMMYFSESLYASHLDTVNLRSVRMDTNRYNGCLSNQQPFHKRYNGCLSNHRCLSNHSISTQGAIITDIEEVPLPVGRANRRQASRMESHVWFQVLGVGFRFIYLKVGRHGFQVLGNYVCHWVLRFCHCQGGVQCLTKPSGSRTSCAGPSGAT